MRNFFIVLCGAAFVGCLFFFFLQPRTAEEISPADPLEERASNGDVDALRALRQRYIAKNQSDLANYWLYKGALIGDAAFTDEYEIRFRGLSDKEKQAEIQSIKTSTATVSQKDALLKRLIAGGNVSTR